MFSGLCGTIAEANKQHSKTALFLIIQFETKLADSKAIERNHLDLLEFFKFLRISNDIKSGQILNISTAFNKLNNYKINYSSKDLEIVYRIYKN